MADATTRPARWHRRATLPLILLVALAMRLVAVGAVQLYTQQKGIPCVFGDTAIYWRPRRRDPDRRPLRRPSGRRARTTPCGPPATRPSSRSASSPSGADNTLAARVVQAVLGTVGVGAVYGLVLAVFGAGQHSERRRARTIATARRGDRGGRAVHGRPLGPAAVGGPLRPADAGRPLGDRGPLAAEAGRTRAIRPRAPGRSRSLVLAVVAGAAIGGALLARPSWALFVPAAAAGLARRRAEPPGGPAGAASSALAAAATMAPWWVRNARVYGRFVPTALWVGASLYDGVSPTATGSSDMGFLEDPEIPGLGEVEQDRVFRERAVDFAAREPGSVLSSWRRSRSAASGAPGRTPTSSTRRASRSSAPSATLPVFGPCWWSGSGAAAATRGRWSCWLGTLLYFCVLHAVFVGSIRYRLPGMVPAFGLAAAGMVRLVGGPPGRPSAPPGGWRPGRS